MSATITEKSGSNGQQRPGGGPVGRAGVGSPRLAAIAAVTNDQPTSPPMNFVETPAKELFGANVFSKSVMKERLPKQIYKSLMRTIESGQTIDVTVADVVAAAMKDWAIEKGATHYAHVFYPLTGLTAEKHDTPSLIRGRSNQCWVERSGAVDV